MALQQEIWISDIQENLYEGQEFISHSMSHDAFIENKTVHVPQAGSVPVIVKDRSSYPATIAQRTDTELTYDMAEFTTDPTHITDIDELQTSYAKRQSVLANQLETLRERIGTETAQIWTPTGASKIIRTTGASTATLPAGATGTRKLVTKEDIFKLAERMDSENVAQGNRFLLMTTSMYYELFQIDALVRKDFMNRANLPDGVIDQLANFNIMVRPTVSLITAADGKLAVGASATATDSFGCLAWQQNSVAKAKGSIKVFADEDKPEFYGSIFSALVMHGASRLRSDDKGVFTLAQGA
ncbi:MAG: phage capsid protein [Nitrosomonadaceae bacterium]